MLFPSPRGVAQVRFQQLLATSNPPFLLLPTGPLCPAQSHHTLWVPECRGLEPLPGCEDCGLTEAALALATTSNPVHRGSSFTLRPAATLTAG